MVSKMGEFGEIREIREILDSKIKENGPKVGPLITPEKECEKICAEANT